MAKAKKPAWDAATQLTTDLHSVVPIYEGSFRAKMDRMDPTRTAETSNQLALRKAYGDPTSLGFAGRFSDDTKEILNWRKSQLDPRNKNYAGNLSSDVTGALTGLRNRAASGSARSGDMADVVSRYKAGLSGYSSAENNAFRDAGMREMRAGYATDRQNAVAAGARMGVRGASALAQQRSAARDLRTNQAAFETDLFARNADEKQRRLESYGGFLRDLETAEFARGGEAARDYADYAKTADDMSYGRVQDALSGYQDFQQGAEKEYFNRGQTAIKDYQDYLNQTQEVERAIQTFNIQQGEKEQATNIGSLMGLLGMLETMRNTRAQNDIMKRQASAAGA